jgi:hypothetical protein
MLIISFIGTVAQTQLTNLPTIIIDTENRTPITDKTNYVNARLTVLSSNPEEAVQNVVTGIRGRGNSTWDMPKKPYRIKLDKKANLLGLKAKAKSWVLLANYADKTLMRNAVAFKISELTELAFTPSVKFVDLYINNAYQGNYMLTDQIQEGVGRVDIEEMPASPDATEITGGYLLEIDGFASGEPYWFTTNHGLPITIKYPDETLDNPKYQYIKNFVNSFEGRLFSAEFKDPVAGYRPMVDTTSLINWYICCELTGNPDSFWSTFIYKQRSIDKLFFGPLWDYDIAFNNDNRLGDAINKLMRQEAHAPRTWIEQLWKDDWFRLAVEQRWKELVASDIEQTLINYIDETVTLLDRSQQQNFFQWRILGTLVYREQFLFPTYQGGVDYLKTYIRGRIAFLNQKLIIPESEKPTPPFEADNFYYSIMNKRTNNVIDITDESGANGALLMLWHPVEDKQSQLWKIEAVDDTYFRFVSKRSGLVMTATEMGTNLIQTERNDSDPAQKWRILPAAPGGLYGIVSDATSNHYSVNNNAGSFEDGNKVIVWTNNITGSENQQWYIAKRDVLVANEKPLLNIISPFKWYSAGSRLIITDLPDNSIVILYSLNGVRLSKTLSVGNTATLTPPKHGLYTVAVQVSGVIKSSQIVVY